MRKLIPIRESVVCKKINNNNKKYCRENGVLYKKEEVDLYEILSISSEDTDFNLCVGDVIMSCSTGDEIEVDDGNIIYLFKIDNIMCKVQAS